MDAGQLLAFLGLDITSFVGGMKEAQAATDQTTEMTATGVNGIGSAFETITGTIGKLGIAAAITGIGVEALDVVNKIDKLHAAFETFNGTGAETEKLFENIGNLELTSVFDFEDVLGPAAQTLLKFGLDAEQTQKTMSAFVDTASAMKLDPSKIDSLATIMGRMNNETALSAKSMKQLTNEIGTSGWEALAKSLGVDVKTAMAMVKDGAVDAKSAVAGITEGLSEKFSGKAEEMTHTWAGAMNQLDQATEDVMVALGRTLKDVLTTLAPILETVVGWIKTAAEWFTNLPGPVKEAVIVFGGVVAAVAAVSAAMAVIGPILAVVAGAFSLPVVAIAALVAALVGLGVWIHSNWGAIVAVLQQSWEVVKVAWKQFELWVLGWLIALAKPIVDFASKIPGLGDALNPLKEGLLKLDSAQKSLAASTDAQAASMKSLGAVWNDAKAKAEAQKGAQVELTEATDAGKKATVAHTAAITGHTAAAAAAKAASKAHAAALKEAKEEAQHAEKFLKFYNATLTANHKATEKAKTTDEELTKALDKSTAAFLATEKAAADVTAGVDLASVAFIDAGASITRIKEQTDPAIIKASEYAAAMKALGFTSRDELQRTADQAQVNYKAIVASDLAPQWQKDSALIRLLEAQKAAAKAAGGDITKDQQAMLDKLNEQAANASTGLPKTESAFKQFGTNVSTVITNAAQDMMKSLWEGDMSFGEKGKAMLSSLGQAVMSSFVEPATAAMNTFINGVIKDLIGGKGLGGIMDRITGIGDSLGGIFKGGGGTAVPGVPNVPTGGAPAAGGVGGAMGGGLSGILTSVFSGISAVTDVLGMFGVGVQGRIKELLGEIHNDTSYLAWNFDQGGLHDALLGHANNFAAYLDAFGSWYHDAIANLTTAAEYILPEVTQTRIDTSAIRGTLETLNENLNDWMSRPINVNVKADGITTADAAKILADQIANNLARQLASATLR